MQINPESNPYQAPAPEQKKPRVPFLRPFIKKAGEATLMGTIMSAPVVTLAAINEECQDKVLATFSSFIGHLMDWTSRIGPLGYGVSYRLLL